MSRASQVELDIEAILDGMHGSRRSPLIPDFPDELE